MAQQQLVTSIAQSDPTTSTEDVNLVWEPNQVIYKIDERFSLIVKRGNGSVYLLVKSGTKCMKLPFDVYDAMCHAQVSVNYIKQNLEKNQRTCRGLCVYCGLQFDSKKECRQHESRDHTMNNEICFHANLMECIDCYKCGPGVNMELDPVL